MHLIVSHPITEDVKSSSNESEGQPEDQWWLDGTTDDDRHEWLPKVMAAGQMFEGYRDGRGDQR